MPEQPVYYGSDAIADVLRAHGFRHIALTPGASFRGLHDSLVNYLGNVNPEMVLCLHEEHAVAVAHGYAKVSGTCLPVALHSNVGLMHAAMAIYNAWCDRVPMIILGATGPLDAERRRPWIDWIHTSQDQAQVIRSYCKWDDQPISAAGAVHALLHGIQMTQSYPQAPVYINCDTELFEAPCDLSPEAMQSRTWPRIDAGALSPEALEHVVGMLQGRSRILCLFGRMERTAQAFSARIDLIEAIDATVVTDLRTGSTFPTQHQNHLAPGTLMPTSGVIDAVREADLILSFDWIDLGGLFRQAFGEPRAPQPVISFSPDHGLHNGWSKDGCEPAATTSSFAIHPDQAIRQLAVQLQVAPASQSLRPWQAAPRAAGPLSVQDLGHVMYDTLGGEAVTLIRTPISWQSHFWPFSDALSHLGFDGGGGIGSGLGMAIGAALALRDQARLPVAVLGDGDYLMGVSALWTAVHHHIPLLIVIANNRSFFNDEVHQERVAITRGRDVNNKGVGIRIEDPDPDFAGLARAQGALAAGPVTDVAELERALEWARTEVHSGQVVVLDVHVARSY